jgi:hypothetical protein
VTSESKKGVLYLVHRIGWWRRHGTQFPLTREGTDGVEQIQGRPVRVFTDRRQAEAFRREQESAITADKNPLEYVDEELSEITSMDEDVFADLVTDLGLEPPEVEGNGKRHWGIWCADMAEGLTAEHRAAIWPHVDRVQFFQIVEVPLEG